MMMQTSRQLFECTGGRGKSRDVATAEMGRRGVRTKDLHEPLGGLEELVCVDTLGSDGYIRVVAGGGLEVSGHCRVIRMGEQRIARHR
jgi:hypothetical protein